MAPWCIPGVGIVWDRIRVLTCHQYVHHFCGGSDLDKQGDKQDLEVLVGAKNVLSLKVLKRFS